MFVLVESSDTLTPSDSAHHMLATIVTPLLKIISKATGLGHLTLLCGSAPTEFQDNYVVSAVHYGKSKGPVPRNFYMFDEEAFRVHVLPQFCKYLSATTGKRSVAQLRPQLTDIVISRCRATLSAVRTTAT